MFRPSDSPQRASRNSPSARRRRRKLNRRNKRRRQPRRLLLQPLEDRRLLAVFAWDGGGDGTSFGDAANWAVEGVAEPATAPGPNDDVIIDLDGQGTEYQILLNDQREVRSVQINDDDARLQVDNGVLTAQSIDVTSGRLVAFNGDITATTLTNDDRLSVGRTVTFDVDQILNRSSLVIASSASTNLTVDGEIRNSGSLTLNTTVNSSGTLTVSGGITNEAEGTIQIGSPTTSRTQVVRSDIDNFGSLVFASPNVTFDQDNATITNSGELRFEAGTRFVTFDSNITLNQLAGTLRAAGDVLLDDGALKVAGGAVTIEDLILVDNDGTIQVSGGTIVTENGRLQLNQRGQFDFRGGDITGTNAVQLFGTIDLQLAHDGSFAAETRGNITVAGNLATGQSLSVIAGNSALIFQPGSSNGGTIVFDNPDGSAQTLSTADGSIFRNAPTGVVRFTRSDSFAFIGAFIGAPIDNEGSIIVDTIVSDSKLHALKNVGNFLVTEEGRYTRSNSGSGTTREFLQQGGVVENLGRFDGNGLTFQYTGGQAVGQFTPRNLIVAAGSGNSGTFRPTGSLEGDIQTGQTVIIEHAFVDQTGPISNAGTLRLIDPSDTTAASIRQDTATITNLELGLMEFIPAAGEIARLASVGASLVNEGTVHIVQGTGLIDGIVNRGIIDVASDATLRVRDTTTYRQVAGELNIDGSVVIQGLMSFEGGDISGQVQLSSGQLSVSPTAGGANFLLTDGGDLESDIPAGIELTFSNRGSETNVDRYRTKDDWRVQGDVRVGDAQSTGDRIEFTTSGDVSIDPTGRLQTDIDTTFTGTLVNRGQILVQAPLTFGSGNAVHTNSGDVRIQDSTLRIIGDSFHNANQGTIAGTGSVTLDDGVFGNEPTEFQNAGAIAPGQSPGSLDVTATTANLTGTSRLFIEVDGNQPGSEFDTLGFSGNLALGGLLDVRRGDNASLAAGEILEVVRAASIDGSFDLINGTSAGIHEAFQVLVDADSVDLKSSTAIVDLKTNIEIAATSLLAGEEGSIRFSVSNLGPGTTTSAVRNQVYLQPEGEPFNIAKAIRLAEVEQECEGNECELAANESFSQTVNFRVPGIAPGFYRYFVISDSQQTQADPNRGNNIATSAELVEVDYRRLTLDSLLNLSLPAGESQFLELELPPGKTAELQVETDTPGSYEVYPHAFANNFGQDRLDALPCTTTDGTETCRTTFQSPAGTSQFIEVRSVSGSPTLYRVRLSEAAASIDSITPGEVSAGRSFTTTVRGVALDRNLIPKLQIGLDGRLVEAESISIVSSERMNVRWPATDPGRYRFFLADSEGTEIPCRQEGGCIVDVGEAQAEESFRLDYRFEGVEAARANRLGTASLGFTNNSRGDVQSNPVVITLSNATFPDGSTTRLVLPTVAGAGRTIPSGSGGRIPIRFFPTEAGDINLAANEIATPGSSTTVAAPRSTEPLPAMIVEEFSGLCIETNAQTKQILIRGRGFVEKFADTVNGYTIDLVDATGQPIDGASSGLLGTRLDDNTLSFDLSDLNLAEGIYTITSLGRNLNSSSGNGNSPIPREKMALNVHFEVKAPGAQGSLSNELRFFDGVLARAFDNSIRLGRLNQGQVRVAESFTINTASLFQAAETRTSVGLPATTDISELAALRLVPQTVSPGIPSQADIQTTPQLLTASNPALFDATNALANGAPSELDISVSQAINLSFEAGSDEQVIQLSGSGFEATENGLPVSYVINIVDANGNPVPSKTSGDGLGDRINDGLLEFDISNLELPPGKYFISSLVTNPNSNQPSLKIPLRIRFEVKAPGAEGTVPNEVTVYSKPFFGAGQPDPLKFAIQPITLNTAKYIVAGRSFVVSFNSDGTASTQVPALGQVRREGDNLRFTDANGVEFLVDASNGRFIESITPGTGDVFRPVTNDAGQITAIVKHDGNKSEVVDRFTYNDAGCVSEVQTNDTNVSLRYNDEGGLRSANIDGFEVSYEYGSVAGLNGKAVTRIVAGDRTDSNGNTIVGGDFSVNYGTHGEITTVNNSTTGVDYEFAYGSGGLDAIVGSDGTTLTPSFSDQVQETIEKFANRGFIAGLASTADLLRQFANQVVPLTVIDLLGLSTGTTSDDETAISTDLHNRISDVADALPEAVSPASNQSIPGNSNAADQEGSFVSEFGKSVQQFLGSFLELTPVDEVARFFVDFIASFDPNDIEGPAGVGPGRHVRDSDTLPYNIRFENLDTATAPAQEVFVTQVLDDDLDLDTFAFQSFGWNDIVVDLPPGLQSFDRVVDLRGEQDLVVNVSGELDPASRTVRWEFQSLDPLTGDFPADPFAGFLPPNVVAGTGEGFVRYAVSPLESTASGERIDALATIVFDTNDPIETPPIFNTIDSAAPQASVNTLPEETATSDFTVSWSGSDTEGGSGIRSFDVFVSTNGGPFEPFLLNTTATSALFSGQDGDSYAFRAVATDHVGFVEQDPGSAEAATTIVLNKPPVAEDDQFETNEDEVLTGNVLSNDSDPDNDVLSAVLVESVAHGVLSLGSNGSFQYTPGADFNGTDSFTYSSVDPDGAADTATVSILVKAVNDAPTVANPIDDITVDEDAANQTIDLSNVFADIDSSDLTLSVSSSNPSLVAATLAQQKLTLAFGENQNGVANITVVASDGDLTVSETFHVTVKAVNDAPIAGDDVATTKFETSITIDVLDNDSDIDGDSLTIALTTGPENGIAEVVDNRVFFTPNEGFAGRDQLTYTVSDGSGGSAIAVLTLEVEPPENVEPVRLVSGVLLVDGDQATERHDKVLLAKIGSRIKVAVKHGKDAPKSYVFHAKDVDAVNVQLGEGNDKLITARNFPKPIMVNGGEGNNWIQTGTGDDLVISGAGHDIIFAGAGNDVVSAGGGNDWVHGGHGRDVLIGGDGRDWLLGGNGQDLLIGDRTIHDQNDAALIAILTEWSSTRSRETRVRNLTDGSGSAERFNGNFFLDPSSIKDDDDRDRILGGKGKDWLL